MKTVATAQQGRRHRGGASILLAGGLLVACSAPQDSEPQESAAPVDYDPGPQLLEEQLPEADEQNDAQVPTQFEEGTLVETSWGTPPQEADDVFLAPGDTGGKLTFTAVDAEGTALWEAERPLSCAGFTLTTDGDRTLAILSDIDEDAEGNPLGEPTVTAYDLHTGEEVWGPVEVPGPHQGPGMLFAAPPEESFGELGSAVVLDPATGEILFDERQNEGLQVLGEHHGTIVVAEENELQGFSADDAEPQWATPLNELGWAEESLRAGTGQNSGHVNAMLIGATDEDRTLINLDSGDIMAEDLQDAGQDPTSGTWLTLGDQLAGIDPDGEQIFTVDLAEDSTIETIGGVLAYLSREDQLHIYNAVTGEEAHAYQPGDQGPLAIPTHITGTGVGVLDVSGDLLLATNQSAE